MGRREVSALPVCHGRTGGGVGRQRHVRPQARRRRGLHIIRGGPVGREFSRWGRRVRRRMRPCSGEHALRGRQQSLDALRGALHLRDGGALAEIPIPLEVLCVIRHWRGAEGLRWRGSGCHLSTPQSLHLPVELRRQPCILVSPASFLLVRFIHVVQRVAKLAQLAFFHPLNRPDVLKQCGDKRPGAQWNLSHKVLLIELLWPVWVSHQRAFCDFPRARAALLLSAELRLQLLDLLLLAVYQATESPHFTPVVGGLSLQLPL
mmetsp:Transcript_905/g.2355  ORF Transcript_905/g.2355 Transcript_905/m.2355 type:complete len:262 (-) Transcript_905:469-1254(-)